MSYSRIKFFWGALDIIHSDESPYTAAQTKALGTSALPPGIGVRRATLVWNRTGMAPAQDKVVTHMDFLNLTAGEPDDSWVDADFTTLEGYIDTAITAIKPYWSSLLVLEQIRWYRVGPSIVPPNPAVRITARSVAGTGTLTMPPQVATSVTLKTVPRRQWGRQYWPTNAVPVTTGDGRLAGAAVTAIGGAVNALFVSATSAQFPPVIYSPTRGKAYTVETVQVDNVLDVIRSRRLNEATSKYISP